VQYAENEYALAVEEAVVYEWQTEVANARLAERAEIHASVSGLVQAKASGAKAAKKIVERILTRVERSPSDGVVQKCLDAPLKKGFSGCSFIWPRHTDNDSKHNMENLKLSEELCNPYTSNLEKCPLSKLSNHPETTILEGSDWQIGASGRLFITLAKKSF
jgi:hypothetical protein